MMRSVEVYRNNTIAGTLMETDSKEYVFEYKESYFHDGKLPAVSLTLPKNKKKYKSEYLFPFFFNMLSEGVNRKLQCRRFKIDEKDHFGLLMKTAQFDTIGAVHIKPL